MKRDGDTLITLPFLKDAGLSRRLSRESAHPRSVHTAWLRMMINGIAKVTGNPEVVKEYQDEVRIRLKNDGCFVPTTVDSTQCRKRRCVVPRETVWLPISYHPWWHRSVVKAVRRLNNEPGFAALLEMAMPKHNKTVLKVAWKNMLPSTGELVQL